MVFLIFNFYYCYSFETLGINKKGKNRKKNSSFELSRVYQYAKAWSPVYIIFNVKTNINIEERERERGNRSVSIAVRSQNPPLNTQFYGTVDEEAEDRVVHKHLCRWGRGLWQWEWVTRLTSLNHACLVLSSLSISRCATDSSGVSLKALNYSNKSRPNAMALLGFGSSVDLTCLVHVGLRGWSCQHDLVRTYSSRSLVNLAPKKFRYI